MEAKARQTDIKMTARKLRRVINEVRGKSVVEALKLKICCVLCLILPLE